MFQTASFLNSISCNSLTELAKHHHCFRSDWKHHSTYTVFKKATTAQFHEQHWQHLKNHTLKNISTYGKPTETALRLVDLRTWRSFACPLSMCSCPLSQRQARTTHGQETRKEAKHKCRNKKGTLTLHSIKIALSIALNATFTEEKVSRINCGHLAVFKIKYGHLKWRGLTRQGDKDQV